MPDVVEYGGRRTLVVAAVMLAALMQLADTTIVNVALPTIDGELGASVDEGAWFITAYLVANVIVIPLTPWFQTLLGRKNYFALSIAGFTIASVLCGLAADTSTEIGLRFVQGAFGGGLLVPAQQIIRDTFPPAKLATSQSLFALALILGPTIGPTLGGILTDDLTWRWVFFVNVLPGIAATILVLLFVRDPAAPKRVPFDFCGVALLAVGLASLQYVFDEGERNGWFTDGRICTAAAVSLAALIAFVVWEIYGARTPGVALRTFRHRTVWALAVINFAVAGGAFALIFIQPQWAQTSLGFTTTLAGLLLMVRAGTLAILYTVTTWVASQARWDMRWVAASGMFLAGFASWLQTAVMTTQTPLYCASRDADPRRHRLRVHLRPAQRHALQDRPARGRPLGTRAHAARPASRRVGWVGVCSDAARSRLRAGAERDCGIGLAGQHGRCRVRERTRRASNLPAQCARLQRSAEPRRYGSDVILRNPHDGERGLAVLAQTSPRSAADSPRDRTTENRSPPRKRGAVPTASATNFIHRLDR